MLRIVSGIRCLILLRMRTHFFLSILSDSTHCQMVSSRRTFGETTKYSIEGIDDMGTYEVEQTIKQFGHALTRLEEALTRSAEYDDIVIDATIQRFEFTIELCWKALKKKLASEGVETTTPRT